MFWLESEDKEGDKSLQNLDRYDSITINPRAGSNEIFSVVAWRGDDMTPLFFGTKDECRLRLDQIGRLLSSLGLGRQMDQDAEEQRCRDLMNQTGSWAGDQPTTETES